MRVLVTGGTGFVGSHTVAELVKNGHEVHLLVRSAERIAPALEPLGVRDLQYTVGDVTDPASVEKAMAGCEAVIHAASVYSLDARKAGIIRRTNVRGTDVVLGTAHRLGLDPIVHVSSIAALLPPECQALTPQSSVKNPPGTYTRSKAYSERVARGYQLGAPVVITYPGSVWGPQDPYWGESTQIAAAIFKRQMSMIPRGNIPIIDVRDVAKVHAAVMEPGKGPRRYMIGGNNMRFTEAINMLADLTGRNIPVFTLPAWSLAPVVHLINRLQPVTPFRFPINLEGYNILRWKVHTDDSQAQRELGIEYMSFRETASDMVRWMYQSGGISAKHAGKLAIAEVPA